MDKRPEGANADEWHLFLCDCLVGYRASCPDGLPLVAVQIAEAIEAAEQRGYRVGYRAAAEDAAEWE